LSLQWVFGVINGLGRPLWFVQTTLLPWQQSKAMVAHGSQARLDVAALDRAVEHYLANGVAMSTLRVYEGGVRKYIKLCSSLNQPCTPASETLLCRYVVCLAMEDIAHSSIKVYLSGVQQPTGFPLQVKGIHVCHVSSKY